MNSDRKTQRLGVAAGVLFGICSGVGVGATFHNVWIVIGFVVALGSAVVLAFGSAGSHSKR